MQQNPNDMPKTQDERHESPQSPDKRKKILKAILIFSVAVLVLYAVFMLFDPETRLQRFLEKEAEDNREEIELYPLDDELNTPDNEEYLEKDSRMFYHDPFEGVTYSIEEETLLQESAEVQFFYEYFAAIREGDDVAYAALFSTSYDGDIAEDFTQQLLYDITVYPQTSGGSIVSYRVEYRIFRNNGSFRDDVGSDTIRPLLIELERVGNSLKIKSVSTYTSHLMP